MQSQVVSANKFEQNLREIDGSIVAVSQKELQNLQIQNTQDLSKILPGFVLKMTSGSAYNMVSVRGINSVDYFSPSMVVYVDGIPQDPSFITQELLDVKQVELLRGPQGTIWGQNAQAGVLNITTNPIANNIPRLHALTSLGTLSKIATFSASTPLIQDWLYIGGNLSYNRFSGQISQADSKEKLDTNDSILGNISLEFTPKNSSFKTLFKYSKDNLSDHHNGFLLTDKQFDSLKLEKYTQTAYTRRDVDTYALKLGYDFGHSVLSNTTSFQDRDYYQYQPYGAWHEKRKTATEEFRFNTQYDNGAYSIFGLYYQNIKNNEEIVDFTGGHNGHTLVTKNTLALYGEGKIPLWWNFDFTIGARYSYDFSNVNFSGITNILPYKNTYKQSIFTPKAAFGINLGENARLYALYQMGYKPGGFNYYTVRQSDADLIKPENTQNFEIGMHSNFWENHINLDLAAYYIYITDKQGYIGVIGTQSLKNFGTASSKGIEINLAILPIESLKISFGSTLGQSRYVKGYDTISIPPKDFKNNALSYAPDVTINLNADWKFWSIKGAKFFFNINGNYYSKTYFDEENTVFQDPYVLLDGSIRIEIKNGLTLNLYSQNIFNQKYKNYSVTGYGNILGELRNIGLSLSYRL